MKKLMCSMFIFLALITYAKKPDQIKLDIAGAYGPINGFIQIPKGGQFGSTDVKRPELDEMNIDNLPYLNASLEGTWGKNTFYVATQLLDGGNIKSTSTLSQNLLTHGINLPKGTDVQWNIPINIYSLGMLREFKNYDKFKISFLLALDIIRTRYAFDAVTPNGQKISDTRGNFIFGVPTVGVRLKYLFTPTTYAEFDGRTNLGIFPGSVENFFYTSLKFGHIFYNEKSTVLNKMSAYVGIDGYALTTRDSQDDMQNFIHINQFPVVVLGLEFIF